MLIFGDFHDVDSRSEDWYHIILLGNRGMWVWTICLRLLRSSTWLRIELTFLLQVRRPPIVTLHCS